MADIEDSRDVGVMSTARTTGPLRALLRAATLALAVATTMIACGPAARVRREDPPPPIHGPDSSEPSAAQPGPSEGAVDGHQGVGRLPPHPDGVEPLGPNSRAALQDWADGLRNAATRDRETEIIIRGYLSMARDVFARFRGSQSGPGKQGAYDPEPAWRFHLSAAASLIDLSARAALLEELYRATAAAQAIDLERPGPMGSRGERIQLYATLAGCIREDTWIRAMHGATLMRALGSKPVPLERAESAEMMRREIGMIRVTMKCTSLASRRRPPDPGGG